MPYSGVGKRQPFALARAAAHGAPVVVAVGAVGGGLGIPGIAFKVDQVGTFVDPSAAAATQIAAGVVAEIDFDGIHEAARSGNLATADLGTDIYIQNSTDTLGLAAQALTGAVLNATWLPFGKVVERDALRTPQVLRVALNLRSLVRGTLP
ncbi:MAG: hypothetical protein LC798_12755 [Chloroflexi bacterium]|nr:hypothetical protein [Chloroflexota bacterium]